ncbi:MAG: transcription antitermination factor NusB [Eubacteriales bacterium]|nr:transcription antitermination factor NusB [Eubacteriales bacterium]
MSRKVAREVAMKLVFAKLAGGEDTYEAVLEKSGIDATPAEEDIAYADEVIAGIEAHAEEIDALIDDIAIGWKIERMPKVDLSILRIAVYEMQHRDDIPCSVSINEAVELAKEFGGDKSSSYVNGMLGTLAKRMEN